MLGGEKTNLRELENATIRDGFRDPRIHAARNRASCGCPRLPRKAFEPESLGAELDAAMTEFVGETRNVAVDPAARTVTLSKIFDWFETDFQEFERSRGRPDPRLLDHVNRHRGIRPVVPRGYRVLSSTVDKALNGRESGPAPPAPASGPGAPRNAKVPARTGPY